jgi:chitinase
LSLVFLLAFFLPGTLSAAQLTVSITNPVTGTVYHSPEGVIFTAAASAAGNQAITSVEFYDGSTLKFRDTVSPYTFLWYFSSAANGTHTWTAKVYDASGNSAVSPPVYLFVNIPVDTTAPSIPTGLTASATSCSQINLSWTASTDTGGSGLAGYKVFRNGVQIATTNLTSYNSTGLTGATSYVFTVAAYDNAGNTSGQSASRSVTTPSCLDTTAPSIPTGLTASATSCQPDQSFLDCVHRYGRVGSCRLQGIP